MPHPALSSLLNSKADLSGDMALRIEKAFGVKMETLMRMQSAYDIAKTRSREKGIRVRRFHPHAAAGRDDARRSITLDKMSHSAECLHPRWADRRCGCTPEQIDHARKLIDALPGSCQ